MTVAGEFTFSAPEDVSKRLEWLIDVSILSSVYYPLIHCEDHMWLTNTARG
jgi:hypothetical protein